MKQLPGQIKLRAVGLALINILFLIYLSSVTFPDCGSPLVAIPCPGPAIYMGLAIVSFIIFVILFLRKSFNKLFTLFLLFDLIMFGVLIIQQVQHQFNQISVSRNTNSPFQAYDPSYLPEGYGLGDRGYYEKGPGNSKAYISHYYYHGDYNKSLTIYVYFDVNRLTDSTLCHSLNTINPTPEYHKCTIMTAADGTKVYASDPDSKSGGRHVYLKKDPKSLIYISTDVNNNELIKLVTSLRPVGPFSSFIPGECWRLENFMCINSLL